MSDSIDSRPAAGEPVDDGHVDHRLAQFGLTSVIALIVGSPHLRLPGMWLS